MYITALYIKTELLHDTKIIHKYTSVITNYLLHTIQLRIEI